MNNVNGYELSRNWFDFCFENPDIIKPVHSAIFFFAVEHCNRLGWKHKFGFPSQMAMEALGIKNWRTYSKALNDLVEFGFIEMIEVSRNQYSSNIIAIVKNTKAHTKALDKALQKHSTKQGTKHSTKQGQSTVSIDKQYNKEQLNKEQLTKNNTLMSNANASDVTDLNKPYFEISKAFYQLFKNNADKLEVKWSHLDNAKADNFIQPLRLLIESDKRTIEDLRLVWKFLQADEFWMPNIQSSAKLRKNFDQLITKAKQHGKENTANNYIESIRHTDLWKNA